MLITERDVVAVIRGGARSVDEVGRRCDAGTGCGSCRGGIDLLIQAEIRRRSRSSIPEGLFAQLKLFGQKDDE